jgi:CHAT domain-containing protein/Tfp pilus assembly protein PilF
MKRTPLWLPLFLISGWLFLPFPAAGQVPEGQLGTERVLQTILLPAPKVGETVSRPFSTNDENNFAFAFNLKKDDFVEVEAEYRGIDIEIVIQDEAGADLRRYGLGTGKNGKLTVAFIAPQDGLFPFGITFKIPDTSQPVQTGTVSFTVKQNRPATRLDRAVFQAWQARWIASAEPDTRPGIPIAESAIREFQELGEKNREIETTFQLARLYLFSDAPETAIRYLEQTLRMMGDDNPDNLKQLTYAVLGDAYNQVGAYYPALEALKQALAYLEPARGPIPRAIVLRNLGMTYVQIGDYQAALDCLRPAAEVFRESLAYPYLFSTTDSLGLALARTGKPEEARKLFEASLNLLTVGGQDSLAVCNLLLNLCLVHRQLGNRAEALRYAALALEQSRKRNLPALEAEAIHLQGILQQDEGKHSDARTSFQNSLAILKDLQTRNIEAEVLSDLALSEFSLGNPDQAIELMNTSLNLTESTRGALPDDNLRATYLGSVQSRFERLVSFQMNRHQTNPGGGFAEQALLTSERSKARTLIDILRAKNIELEGDPALLAERRQLQNRINEANRALFSLSTSAEDLKIRADIRKDLAGMVAEYRDLLAKLQKQNPKFVRLTEPVALDLAEIRAQLGADSVLLEYALGTEKSYLWAVTRTGLKSYELPGRAAIEDLTRKTYDALTARGRKVKFEEAKDRAVRFAKADAEYQTLSKELGELLLGPVAGELSGKKLLVVGDGALLYLPFAALPLPTTGKPLVATCEVTQLPSISTLSVLRKDAAGRKPARKTVAVYADPVFETDDARVRAGKSQKPRKPAVSPVRGDVPRAATEIDGEERAGALVRLPFTRTEAAAIAKLVPQTGRSIALDFKASREAVFNQDLSRFRFVHFATHGFLNSATPDLSGVVLSMVDEKGRPTDGFVHAYEVFNLKLPVEMVVLSGCRTGLGKEIRGEGMIGLTRAFLYAGAERVMVSLWSVEDAATATLMADTYSGMLKRKLRPAAALRAAQIKMMADPKHAHPYYWAAFTLQGEPR